MSRSKLWHQWKATYLCAHDLRAEELDRAAVNLHEAGSRLAVAHGGRRLLPSEDLNRLHLLKGDGGAKNKSKK
jgi:hypothetical protein